MYSGLTSGRVLDGELLYMQFILSNQQGNMPRWLERNLYETVCRQMQTN